MACRASSGEEASCPRAGCSVTAVGLLSEAEFQGQVVELAHIRGWKALHVRRSIGTRNGKAGWQTTTSIKGWPDLFLFRPGRAIAVELKKQTGRLTEEQADCIRELIAAGIPSYVWRPSDWDQIEEVLR